MQRKEHEKEISPIIDQDEEKRNTPPRKNSFFYPGQFTDTPNGTAGNGSPIEKIFTIQQMENNYDGVKVEQLFKGLILSSEIKSY